MFSNKILFKLISFETNFVYDAFFTNRKHVFEKCLIYFSAEHVRKPSNFVTYTKDHITNA